MRCLRLILVAVCGVGAPVAQADPWRPRRVEAFFIEPGRPAQLQWTIPGGTKQQPQAFVLRDYADRVVASGQATVGPDGATATVTLAQGFYELELADTHQRCGVVAMPACAGPPDPFFAIDGALSWLVKDDTLREGLILAARRSGIGMIRERLTWAAVHPAAGRWDWEGAVRFDTLRGLYRQHAVKVLEMAHDAPAWLGRVGKYPADLVRAAESWQTIARRWKSSWGALEVWNEPDIFFGDNLPADQYTALVRALAFGMQGQLEGRPLVGGVVAHHDREFLGTAAANGLVDVIDAFSFHTYARAPEMEHLVTQYRQWLEAAGRPHLPLWITECGRPWKRGPARPPTDQDASSALDITMKAVEARACGVARYFAFVYPYYEENENNFGMMGREGTPLRAMAAYVQAARRLAGAEYVGDLPIGDPRVLRSRVFQQGSTMWAVVYTGKPDPHCRVRLPQEVLPGTGAQTKLAKPQKPLAEAIDGRLLPVDAEGNVPVPDGLVYVPLDPEGAKARAKTTTPASRLWAIGRAPSPSRGTPSGLIARYEFDRQHVEPVSQGYRLRAGSGEKLPFRVRLYNLADRPAKVAVRLELSAGKVAAPSDRAVEVQARGTVELQWEIELAGAFGARSWVEARLLYDPAPASSARKRGSGVGQSPNTLLAVRLLSRPASAHARPAISWLAHRSVNASCPGRLEGFSAKGPKVWP